MGSAVTLVFISGIFTIVGILISSFVNYKIAVEKGVTKLYKAELIAAYNDLIAFRRLEDLYAKSLATADKSEEAIRRAYRRKLRSSGSHSPSRDTTLYALEKLKNGLE